MYRINHLVDWFRLMDRQTRHTSDIISIRVYPMDYNNGTKTLQNTHIYKTEINNSLSGKNS